MHLPRSLLRSIPTTRSIRAPLAPVQFRPAQYIPRRAYSDGEPTEGTKTSDAPWLLAAVGLGGPAGWYLWTTGPEKKPHHGDEAHDHEHGKVHHEQNTEEEEEGNQAEPASSPEAKGEPEKAVQRLEQRNEASDQRPSEVDKPEAVKYAGGPSTTSGKQIGTDNFNTSNPYTSNPELSHKSEGDADTAKLQGSVDDERKV
ncbi:hypothetical protein PHISCL_03674 [Aspergillus sclerotialis]|uniref:Uncharacterized protein n=1 Tax=Aspergillus sclerotialis TaxID=2070753 RepID=A0A3A2ZL87_9EURO|nr:hypothetical protein PHISCL_03674 [Aspergillus sclerotialis]